MLTLKNDLPNGQRSQKQTGPAVTKESAWGIKLVSNDARDNGAMPSASGDAPWAIIMSMVCWRS